MSNSSLIKRRQSAMAKMSDIQSLAQSMCSMDLPDSNWIQDLPCLPVPDLKTTMDRYLSSLRPVISEQQYQTTLATVKEFVRNEGPQLQRDLKEYANKCQNWATDFWLDDMYLSNPLPLPINSNPLFLFPRQTFGTSDDMLMFATRVIQFSVDFKYRIDRQTLGQDYGSGHGKGKPLCMETYKNFFHSCRIPHEEKDRLLRQSRRSNHIVVASCNQFYILRLGQDPLDNPYRSDLPPLDEACIFDQLSRIYRVSREQALREHQGAHDDDNDKSTAIPRIGLLTTENRKLWARLHKRLCKDEVNAKSIGQIEDCLFVMCLDSLVPPASTSTTTTAANTTTTNTNTNTKISTNGTNDHDIQDDRDDQGESERVEMATTILTGAGCGKFSPNRWFDKFLQVIVGRDGVCGINIEHSASEGITVLRFLEEFPEFLARLHHGGSSSVGSGAADPSNGQAPPSGGSSNVKVFDFSAASLPLASGTSYASIGGTGGTGTTTSTSTSSTSTSNNPPTSGPRLSVSSLSSNSSSKTSGSFVGPASPSLLLMDDKITPLEWRLDQEILDAIQDAQTKMDNMIANFDFKILNFQDFGKNLIKSHNLSPDAFIQLAMQLTYYKAHKKLVSTYESASLRQFRLGRVDNIRANTLEVLEWVKAMTSATTDNNANNSNDDNNNNNTNNRDDKTLVELFVRAITKQVEILRYTIRGGGPDNHLLALRELARVRFDQLPKLYEDPSYSEFLTFKLSTSQLPSERGITVGYGAVVPDGYGCSYNPCEKYIVFCIASFLDCAETSSRRFAKNLRESLREMRQLCEKMAISGSEAKLPE